MHASDGIFSLKSIQGGVTGIRSWIICRQSFIMLFPGAVMLVSVEVGNRFFCLLFLVLPQHPLGQVTSLWVFFYVLN